MPDEIKDSNQNQQTGGDQQQQTSGDSGDQKNKTDDSADQRTQEALEILDILEDPVRSHAFAENLARQAGILSPETKKEEKEVKKTAKDIIRHHLGDEYKHVADKLGEAIDELFTSRLGEVDGKLGEFKEIQSRRQFENEFDSFISANEVTEEEAGLISKQLEIMAPNPKVPLKKFLGEQLELVRYRTGKQADNKERLKRQADNFNKRGSAIGSDSQEKTVQPPKTFNIRDAVQAAARGEKWG